jgi:predicted PhzF superfamily epimerase YddE/YHI9
MIGSRIVRDRKVNFMRIWLVDAFADRPFRGNTAGVVPLRAWAPDQILQAIAAENRCSETAFFVPTGLKGNYQLRWFTPAAEVPLCGHATLAAGAVLLTELERDLDVVVFDTRSGPLVVRETPEGFTLDLPRRPRAVWTPPQALMEALGPVRVIDAFTGEYATIVLSSEADVIAAKPDLFRIEALVKAPRAGCLALTALADQERGYDFVSRFFAPGVGIPEDPVTGSSFADLTPYWCDRLDKDAVTGLQASARGGLVRGLQTLSSTRLLGQVAVYLRGELDARVARMAEALEAVAPVAPVAPRANETSPIVNIADLDREDGIAVYDLEAPDGEEGGVFIRERRIVVKDPPANDQRAADRRG